MNNKQIRQVLAGTFDSVRISKDGTIEAKAGFFYRHGQNAEQYAQAVRRLIPGAVIREAREHWNQWPRDSYWRVEFTLPTEVAS